MEYQLTKRQVQRAESVPDAAAEKPVDVELTLPDYCPDIERILSCSLIPEIELCDQSPDRLNVEGSALIRVLYSDSEGTARAYEYTAPFSESFPLRAECGERAATAAAKPGYLNCRAMSPRKLSLHGAFSLRAVAVEKTDIDYYDYEENDDLQVKKEALSMSCVCGMCSDSFSVQEDIPVNAEIGSLLSHSLSARMTELKSVSGKFMLSAELRLELLYLSKDEKREPLRASYSVPVTRVIDCPGADENAVVDADLSVMSDSLRLNDDALDGSSLLGLEAKLRFTAVCYREQEIELITDAFSTERPVQLSGSAFSCETGVSSLSFKEIGKASVSVDDKIGKVIDVRCERVNAGLSEPDGAISVTAKLNVGILYENSEGELRYVEREAVFSYRPDVGQCDAVLRLRAEVESLSYRLTDDNSLELRADMCYRLCCCRRVSLNVINGIGADDSAELDRDDSLVLYFAEDGDNVWDIAKRFSSRPADIIGENGLDGDSVEGGELLLIPSA